jgi:nitroreductase
MSDFSAIVRERRSIRRFSPEPVPQDLLREIIGDACWAPSWGNTQSTLIYVLSGKALERFKAMLRDETREGSPAAPDIEMPHPPSWPEPYRSRTADLMETRTVFVAREEKRGEASSADIPVPAQMVAAGLFGAPHLLLICIARGLSVPYACFDAGLFTEALALSAHDRGLGTCIMAGVVRHPDLLRELVPESEDLLFIAAMVIGYPDLDAAINRFPRKRAPVDERAVFIG